MGFPVLFISGLGGYASFWQEQVGAFAKRFEVVTFDHRGIGQSDPARMGYTVERMTVDAIALLDALEIRRAHVVGHSTGGAVAQVMAIEHPSRLASVVLSATWTKADAYFRRVYALRKEILERLGPSIYLQSATLLWYPSWWVARNNEKLRQIEAQHLATFAPTEIVLNRIDAMLAFDRTSELGRIKTPTLVIGAEDDIVDSSLLFGGAGAADPGGRGQAVPTRRAFSDPCAGARIQQRGVAVPGFAHAWLTSFNFDGICLRAADRRRGNLVARTVAVAIGACLITRAASWTTSSC